MNDSNSAATADVSGSAAHAERPAWRANARNNSIRAEDRPVTWRGVRDALWELVDPLLPEGGRMCIVGAGNADDVPLARIAERAGVVDLVDIDPVAAHGAIGRAPGHLQDRLRVFEEDVTGGAADVVLSAAAAGSDPADVRETVEGLLVSGKPLGEGTYDVVIGDMLYTQLLQAGLVHLGLAMEVEAAWMREYDPAFTAALVSRLHASAPDGWVVHVHDIACWSERQQQPLPIDQVLEHPFWHICKLFRQEDCDPQLALAAAGARAELSAWWRWPAGPWHDYLVRAVVARRVEDQDASPPVG